MKENVKGKNNSGIIIAVLCALLLASIGFICYDKLLKKEEPKTSDSNCPVCEKCNCEQKQDEYLKLCTLDMDGKTSLDVNSECTDKDSSASNVVVKNIKINSKLYELKYIFEPGEDEDNKYFENSVTKLYINGKLLDAYPGDISYRTVLMYLKIDNNKLILGETIPSDIPPGEHTYDLTDFD